jgi:serine/threonine-protein kinase RsbW
VDFIRRREERSLVVPIEETDAADAITSLNAKVDEFAEQHNLSEDILTKVQTSLDDIIMNIMTHGQAESTVVEVTLIPGWLRITVRDNGSPFDPLSLPTPDVTLPLEEREPGGLGVHLVRNVMDEVEYGYRDGYNVLKMSLKVPV